MPKTPAAPTPTPAVIIFIRSTHDFDSEEAAAAVVFPFSRGLKSKVLKAM